MTEKGSYIIMYGDPISGFFFAGPFKSFLEADLYAIGHESICKSEWWHIVELEAPDDD